MVRVIAEAPGPPRGPLLFPSSSVPDGAPAGLYSAPLPPRGGPWRRVTKRFHFQVERPHRVCVRACSSDSFFFFFFCPSHI